MRNNWFFAVKGKGAALPANHGKKAKLVFPVELTPEQLGEKPKTVVKARKAKK